MSSDLFVFDNFLFPDLFDPSIDHHDIFQPPPPPTHHHDLLQNPLRQTVFLDQITPPHLLSTSPPSHQLQSLSFSHHSPSDSPNGYSNSSVFEIKTEELHGHGHFQSFNQSYGGTEEAVKMMQRSYSSNCFDGKPEFCFRAPFDSVLESPNFQSSIHSSSPENGFSSGMMRRACSTGDLQKMKTSENGEVMWSSSLERERCLVEESNVKVGRYSAEERRERINRYRAKKTQRNFNKTIKYACRKTLADNRARIRGRFARNDEAEEIIKTALSNGHVYGVEEDIWMDGFREEYDHGGGPYGAAQFNYYSNYS